MDPTKSLKLLNFLTYDWLSIITISKKASISKHEACKRLSQLKAEGLVEYKQIYFASGWARTGCWRRKQK